MGSFIAFYEISGAYTGFRLKMVRYSENMLCFTICDIYNYIWRICETGHSWMVVCVYLVLYS